MFLIYLFCAMARWMISLHASSLVVASTDTWYAVPSCVRANSVYSFVGLFIVFYLPRSYALSESSFSK